MGGHSAPFRTIPIFLLRPVFCDISIKLLSETKPNHAACYVPFRFPRNKKITCLNNLSCRVKLLVSEITHLFPLLKTSYIRLMRYHRTEKPQCQYGTPWRGCKADEYRKLCSEPLRTKFKYFNFQIQQKWKEEVPRNRLICILLDVLWKNDFEVHLQST